MAMTDEHDLQRFLEAQNPVIAEVRDELRRGRKQTHWMWFVFPQFAGLGHSAMARRYALASRAEAAAYALHPVLGPRLDECARLVCAVQGRSITEVLGSPDDLKFRSSMTLFAHVWPDNRVFDDALKQYFAGAPDQATIQLLDSHGGPGGRLD